jgi:N-acetylneuraminic acid mutarotase
VKNYGASSVYDGKNVFLFGGSGESPQKGIVQFNTSVYYALYLPVDLPTQISFSSAIWNGESAFIFGGLGPDDDYDFSKIIKFTPYENTISIMNANLPGDRTRTSAVWDGKYAYIFGGSYGEDKDWAQSDEILRYDPVSDKLTVLPTRLPTPRESMSAVWTGSSAYIFGGFLEDGNLTDEILKFTPPKEGGTDADDGVDLGGMIIAGSIVVLLILAVVVYIIFKRRE